MVMKRKTSSPLHRLQTRVVRQVKKSIAVVKKAKSFHFLAPALIAVLVLIILGGSAFLLREQIIVATVNGRPVFRFELNRRMTSSFGKETLENIIMEKLVSQEAKTRGISVSEAEIDAEVDKLSQSLGEGTKIEEVLKLQGMTIADLRYQLKIKMLVEKILQGEVSVTEAEIDDFVKNNAGNLMATDEAKRREEAKGVLFEQKINEKFQSWMGDVFEKAKINRFLK